MQFHVKRLRAFYLNWIRALYKFRYNNNNIIMVYACQGHPHGWFVYLQKKALSRKRYNWTKMHFPSLYSNNYLCNNITQLIV